MEFAPLFKLAFGKYYVIAVVIINFVKGYVEQKQKWEKDILTVPETPKPIIVKIGDAIVNFFKKIFDFFKTVCRKIKDWFCSVFSIKTKPKLNYKSC